MKTLLGLMIATGLLVSTSKLYPNQPTYVDDVADIINNNINIIIVLVDDVEFVYLLLVVWNELL